MHKFLSASLVLATLVLLADFVLLKHFALWQSERLWMLYWIDCPCHFGGGFSFALCLLGMRQQFPLSWGQLSARKLVFSGVIVIAILWEIKEVVEGVPAGERAFNHFLWGWDFYYFNLIKDTLMALLGASLVLRIYQPKT